MVTTTRAATGSETETEPSAVFPRRTRIDSAHSEQPQLGGDAVGTELSHDAAEQSHGLLEVEEEPTDAMIAAVAGESPEIRHEQLQLQVSQLAEHLRERLREVDRREAATNARASQLEADLRASRMWLRERELEFQEREGELRRQIEELQDRLCPGGDSGNELADIETRLQELNERERQLKERESEVRERRFELERQAAAVNHGRQLWQQQQEREERELAQRQLQLTANSEALSREREEALASGEKLLVEQALQLDREREVLAADRQVFEQQKIREQDAMEDLRNSAEGELTDRRTRLEARHDWIERQRVGLENVRSEALSLHRQSLEMRLLAEQLWAQITSRLSPAEVTQSLAQLRTKLAEQYRLEEDQLDTKKRELVELAERITGQHQELTQLRKGLREWASARETEIEHQASALVNRELALDAKEDGFRQSHQAWQAERRRYEQKIRELSSQLRPLPAAA
jgi:hypothetical protein